MELESIFTASKWEILEHLAREPLSPLELTGRCSTSLANISQQLRLLEMAGLVVSERVPNRDRGLPRIKYRLAQDQSYLIATANDFVAKKLLHLTTYNKAILRIWFFDDAETRYTLEKAFWRIEPHLPKIERMGVRTATPERIRLVVLSSQLGELPELKITGLGGKETLVTFDVRASGWPEQAHLLYARQ